MIVLIPAYEPDHRLVELVAAIRASDAHQPIVVVDDGSGSDYAPVFAAVAAQGADVLGHPVNRGKGYALKAGYRHIALMFPGESVVCADCDGQHTPADIAKVGAALRDRTGGGEAIVLGARSFTGPVPARSRVGNDVTRAVFGRATGLRLQDTQTGLRGYPASLIRWLDGIRGDRFEYELEVLLAAPRLGIPILEVPIDTIYLDENASSHFHPIRDSIRVYIPFLRFSVSSVIAFVVDLVTFLVLMAAGVGLFVSVVASRVVSATGNFALNRRMVFGATRSRRSCALRYASLAGAIVVANYLLLHSLTALLGLPLVAAKLLTEVALFMGSYHLQRRVVFTAEAAAETEVTANSQLSHSGSR